MLQQTYKRNTVQWNQLTFNHLACNAIQSYSTCIFSHATPFNHLACVFLVMQPHSQCSNCQKISGWVLSTLSLPSSRRWSRWSGGRPPSTRALPIQSFSTCIFSHATPFNLLTRVFPVMQPHSIICMCIFRHAHSIIYNVYFQSYKPIQSFITCIFSHATPFNLLTRVFPVMQPHSIILHMYFPSCNPIQSFSMCIFINSTPFNQLTRVFSVM